jgi:hypothetical protein
MDDAAEECVFLRGLAAAAAANLWRINKSWFSFLSNAV